MNTNPNRPLRLLLPLLLLTAFAVLSAAAQSRPVPNPQLASKELNARVEALLRQMTLDEKVGQLAQFSAGFADKPSPAKVNEWNAKKRFLKAHLDSDNDVIVNMDFEIDGGVTQAFLLERLKRWRAIFLSFTSFMRN